MEIFTETLEHFRKLLQFNTANPPGNEKPCIQYISEVLSREGLRPQIIESAPNRANLVVRISGNGSAKPLLITSHVDVVHAEEEKWKHPPFSAAITEDCIWGRGAVDMKNMTAYCLATMLALSRQKTRLGRDVIMTAVADEEVGGDFGMGFLTTKFPELVNAEYALGELGGYTVHMQGKRIYPIQVGEKGIFWIKIKFFGSPGHGSIPKDDNAHYKAARFLTKLQNSTMPTHRTQSSDTFFKGLIKAFGPIRGAQFRFINSPMGPTLLKKLERTGNDPDRFATISAMVTNTVNPTGLESGRQHNVVPSTVTLNLDCRSLPGFSGADIVKELEALTGEKLQVEVVREVAGHESSPDTSLFREIEKQIKKADPGAHVIPNLTVGFTDAQYLKKRGVICYGFTPIKLAEDMSFPQLYHGHNERIPVEGFKWGLDVFMNTVKEFCSGG